MSNIVNQQERTRRVMPSTFRIIATKGRWPNEVDRWFRPSELDAFHTAEVLTALFGQQWEAVLISDGDNALFHTFIPTLIDGDAFDADPFIGYSGPVSTTADAAFVETALAHYQEWAARRGLVAEVVRFNPIRRNEREFSDSTHIHLFEAKDIVVVPCPPGEQEQLSSFTQKCRSSVRRGMRDGKFSQIHDADEWRSFMHMYRQSLQRAGAHERWNYSDAMFEAMRVSDSFSLWGVRASDGGELVCASVVIEHASAGYYFMAASIERPMQGANEFLVYGITRYLASRGIAWLILGGGNTSSDEDALFRFKQKFAQTRTPLVLGRMVFQQAEYARRCAEAEDKMPQLRNVAYFLKYRLSST